MKIAIKAEGVSEAVRLLSGAKREFADRNAKTAFRIGTRAVRTIQREFRSASETTSTATARRTGALARSYDQLVERRPDGVVQLDVGLVKPGIDKRVLEYARVHETEGSTTIRAKNGGFLTIPLDAAKTAAGVARGGARDFQNTFVVTLGGGSPIIAQKRGNDIIPLFVLKQSVRVKGRPALLPVAKRDIIPGLVAGVKKNFSDVLTPGARA